MTSNKFSMLERQAAIHCKFLTRSYVKPIGFLETRRRVNKNLKSFIMDFFTPKRTSTTTSTAANAIKLGGASFLLSGSLAYTLSSFNDGKKEEKMSTCNCPLRNYQAESAKLNEPISYPLPQAQLCCCKSSSCDPPCCGPPPPPPCCEPPPPCDPCDPCSKPLCIRCNPFFDPNNPYDPSNPPYIVCNATDICKKPPPCCDPCKPPPCCDPCKPPCCDPPCKSCCDPPCNPCCDPPCNPCCDPPCKAPCCDPPCCTCETICVTPSPTLCDPCPKPCCVKRCKPSICKCCPTCTKPPSCDPCKQPPCDKAATPPAKPCSNNYQSTQQHTNRAKILKQNNQERYNLENLNGEIVGSNNDDREHESKGRRQKKEKRQRREKHDSRNKHSTSSDYSDA